MEKFVCTSANSRRRVWSFGRVLRQPSSFLHPKPRLQYGCRRYSSGYGSIAARWLGRKVVAVVALAGISGGALLVVSCSNCVTGVK